MVDSNPGSQIVTPPPSPTPVLNKIIPPKDLSKRDKVIVFQYFCRQLAAFRNTAWIYADTELEFELAAPSREKRGSEQDKHMLEQAYKALLNQWAQSLVKNAWVICTEQDEGR